MIVLPFILATALVVLQSIYVSQDDIEIYINTLFAGYPETATWHSESVVRTFATPFTEWYRTESGMFFSRIFSLYGFVMAIAPMMFIFGAIYISIRSRVCSAGLLCLQVFVLCLSPVLLFLVAWDGDRIWSYPLFLTLAFLWLLTEAGIETDVLVSWRRRFAIGALLLALTMIIIPQGMDNLDLLKRLLAFAPVLLLLGYNARHTGPASESVIVPTTSP